MMADAISLDPGNLGPPAGIGLARIVRLVETCR